MQEIIFVINESLDGGFEAEALGAPIFAQAETWNELRANVIESVVCHFDDDVKRIIRMHSIKDEVLRIIGDK